MASAVLVSPFSIYDLNMAWAGSADMLILAHLDISDGADAFRTSDSRSKYGSMISSVVLSVFLFFLKPVSTELLTSGSLCWWGNECLIRWMERTDVLSGFRMSLYPYRCLLAIIIVIAIHTVSLLCWTSWGCSFGQSIYHSFSSCFGNIYSFVNRSLVQLNP